MPERYKALYWKEKFVEAGQRVDELEEEVTQLKEQNKKLYNELRAHKAKYMFEDLRQEQIKSELKETKPE